MGLRARSQTMKKYLVSDSLPTAGIIIVGLGVIAALIVMFFLKG